MHGEHLDCRPHVRGRALLLCRLHGGPQHFLQFHGPLAQGMKARGLFMQLLQNAAGLFVDGQGIFSVSDGIQKVAHGKRRRQGMQHLKVADQFPDSIFLKSGMLRQFFSGHIFKRQKAA